MMNEKPPEVAGQAQVTRQNHDSFVVGPPGFEPGISAVLIDRQCEGDVLTSWTTGPSCKYSKS